LIVASAYDIFVSVTGKDIIAPDSKFYSINGRYVSLVFEGYGGKNMPFTKDLLLGDKSSDQIFIDALKREKMQLPPLNSAVGVHFRLIGILYFIFGYSTICVRVFNICLSILSVYLLYNVARRYFERVTANFFLLLALFLPTLFVYSITMSRDMFRVFLISLAIWTAYYIMNIINNIGEIWVKRLKLRF